MGERAACPVCGDDWQAKILLDTGFGKIEDLEGYSKMCHMGTTSTTGYFHE